MKVRKIIILPLILSIIVSLNQFVEMAVEVRRSLVLLTLGTLLWLIYDQLKEPVLHLKVVIVVIVVSLSSVFVILVVLLKNGW